MQQIEKGIQKIDGYTCHHTKYYGKMELADEDEHGDKPHIGDRAILVMEKM